MNEISDIHKAITPRRNPLCRRCHDGQDAVNTAKAFHDVLNFDGVVLTKLDGDTRWGSCFIDQNGSQ